MSDDEDPAEDYFATALANKNRGANDYWHWSDKPEKEAGAAREVLERLGIAFEQLAARAPGDDPPDCECVIDGKRCGIEVTELIHEKTLKSSIKGKHQYYLWDKGSLCEKLQDLLDRKDKSEGIKGGPYDRYMLVIVTDEFVLGGEEVTQFLSGAAFQCSFITEVYFALSYDPVLRTCPVFPLVLKSRT